MAHLLVVENDFLVSQALRAVLKNQGYKVSLTGTLKRAHELLATHRFDLVLIDRLLDDGDGQELVEYIRENNRFLPLICLSQLNQVEDRVMLLREGADDYLGKPFSSAELVLKIHKLLSSQKVLQPQVLAVGQIKLYPATGQLEMPGKKIALRRRETQILSCLFRYQNQVVTRETLIEYVWQNQAELPTYTTLDVYIRRLRICLGQYHELIQTVRGFGYRACLAVAA